MSTPPAPVPQLEALYAPAGRRPLALASADHFFWQPLQQKDVVSPPPPAPAPGLEYIPPPATAASYFTAPAPAGAASSATSSTAAAEGAWGRLQRVDPTPDELSAIVEARFAAHAAAAERAPVTARAALDRDLLDALTRVQQGACPIDMEIGFHHFFF